MAATRKALPKPRLRTFDDMFRLENNASHAGGITTIAISDLIPFAGHPFRLYDGERLDDMVESVRANGILVPITVSRTTEGLVILAGHNRVNAAKQAGLDAVPAIVLDNVSDEDAMVYVIETNLIQRSFSDMAHSEKAAVVALHHSKMFSQGKRNDILEQIKMIENPHEHWSDGTFGQVGQKLYSRELIAKEYNLSSRTVARYLSVNQLIGPLKALLDADAIPLVAAVTLSSLKAPEQEQLADYMEQNNLTINMKMANALRLLSEDGKLSIDGIRQVLSGEAKPITNRTPTVKIDRNVYAKYFKPNQSTKEIQAIVAKALELFFQVANRSGDQRL